MSDTTEQETVFAVFCEDGGRSSDLTATRLGEMPFDLASWGNLLELILGRSRFAEMTIRSPKGQPARKVKVMLQKDAPDSHSYDDIR
jgi:hypothetical protein